MEENLKDKRNHFGQLSNDYVKFRRGYPTEIFEIIKSRIKNNDRGLDVGCGTGVATKEITKFIKEVIGTDKEEGMLEQARSYAPECKFINSKAEEQPFADNYFDIISVAQAFHWFDYDKALKEFKRLLKTDGVLVIFRKSSPRGDKILPQFVWNILTDYFSVDERIKKQDDFSFLKQADFKNCEFIEVQYEDKYTAEEYLGFLKTY